LLFDQTQFVRADDAIEVPGQPGFFHLQRQALRMGVGDQHRPLAGGAQRVQKIQRVRMNGDQVADFAFEGHDVQR